MKRLIFFLIFTFILLSIPTIAQTVFEYDAAGNCTVKYKTVTIPAKIQAQPADTTSIEHTETPPAMEDLIGKIKITILPNPTKGTLQIDIQNKHIELLVSYQLNQLDGKQIINGKTTESPLLLDLNGYATGVYLLRLTINGKSEIYKIIKQ